MYTITKAQIEQAIGALCIAEHADEGECDAAKTMLQSLLQQGEAQPTATIESLPVGVGMTPQRFINWVKECPPVGTELFTHPPAPKPAPGVVGQQLEDGFKAITQKFGHQFWGAGEPDCPQEIKASNGELFKLRCKKCGQDNPASKWCVAIAQPPAPKLITADDVTDEMVGAVEDASAACSAFDGCTEMRQNKLAVAAAYNAVASFWKPK